MKCRPYEALLHLAFAGLTSALLSDAHFELSSLKNQNCGSRCECYLGQ